MSFDIHQSCQETERRQSPLNTVSGCMLLLSTFRFLVFWTFCQLNPCSIPALFHMLMSTSTHCDTRCSEMTRFVFAGIHDRCNLWLSSVTWVRFSSIPATVLHISSFVLEFLICSYLDCNLFRCFVQFGCIPLSSTAHLTPPVSSVTEEHFIRSSHGQ